MRIAMVAPLFEHVPPRKYGGTERVVSFMVEELVRLGHTVTLYATGGSQTSAHLVECCPDTLRELGIGTAPDQCQDAYTAQLALAASRLDQHDIVHVHHGTYAFHLKLLKSIDTVPIVWTDHNSIHNDDKPKIFKSMAKLGVGFTALSNSHRNTSPDVNWLETVTTSNGVVIQAAILPATPPLMAEMHARSSTPVRWGVHRHQEGRDGGRGYGLGKA